MKNNHKFQIFASVLFALILLCACKPKLIQTANYEIIPKPMKLELGRNDKEFILNENTIITYSEGNVEIENNAKYLRNNLNKLTGLNLKISDENIDDNIISLCCNADIVNPEGYVLEVGDKAISINGASSAGNFYGVLSLLKSIPQFLQGPVRFPEVTIIDKPRFSYRGAHFDVARHFFPADSVKSFIDMLALHNINIFHWHLTDDQGWRIEIKSRPLLTLRDREFYTQDDIKDIINYAAEKYITIIPEIDLPGHMKAALRAYPELGCEIDSERNGNVGSILCAGKEETYKFLNDVLGEVGELFPGELIHIGGDECPKEIWERCSICQNRIAELNLTSEKDVSKEDKLQSYVMNYAADFLRTEGKRVIGWDEILDGGVSGDLIVMSWRGEDGGIRAAKEGHDVIMVPSPYLYFDYYQTLDKEKEPDAIGGYLPIEKVYNYNPLPDTLTRKEQEHILGLQSNLWTEYISTLSHAQYMELPRLAALSELQWSFSPKDYSDFVKRLPQIFSHYRANGYNFSTHVYDIKGEAISRPEEKTLIYELSTAGDIPIYYSIDGSEPTENSAIYDHPFKIDKKTKIKAATFENGMKNAAFTDSVTVNKATWKRITLDTPINPGYATGGADILVDGRFGRNAVEQGSWLGFNSDEIIAIVDLGKAEEISSVSIRTLAVTGAWIFDTRGITIEISHNGTTWDKAIQEEYPSLPQDTNHPITHKLDFKREMVRYVKIIIEVEKYIPEWHPASGEHAFVFLDEIEIF